MICGMLSFSILLKLMTRNCFEFSTRFRSPRLDLGVETTMREVGSARVRAWWDLGADPCPWFLNWASESSHTASHL